MSSRGGARYEYDPYYDDIPPPERERPRRRREYEEVDVDIRERDYRRTDYLREDYGRNNDTGPLVRTRSRGPRRDEEVDIEYERAPKPRRREEKEDINVELHDARGPARRRDIDEIDVEVRETRGTPRRKEAERGEIEIDRRDTRGKPREPERDYIAVDVRETHRTPRRREVDDAGFEISRGPPPPREDREIPERRGEGERRKPRREEVDTSIRENDRPRRQDSANRRIEIDIDDRRGARSVSRAPPPRERDEVDIAVTHEDNPRTGHRDTIAIREKSPSSERSRVPRGVPIMREREEFIYRRRRSPSPEPPPPRGNTEEIAIRVRRDSPSPSPSPPRQPSPPPQIAIQPEIRPPIIQEVITHHRHIDHGVIRAPPSAESSPSPPPTRSRREDIEVDIRRKDAKGNITEEDIRIIDRREKPKEEEKRVARRRSQSLPSAPAPLPASASREDTTINVNIDADLLGNSDRRLGPVAPPPKPRPREMWTEVTKDLVTREAISVLGYQFEETEDFFYIMEYLRYDDVVRLVEVSDDIRSSRRDRISQMQWEQQDPRLRERERSVREVDVTIEREAPPPRRSVLPAPDGWDERVYEREVVYEEILPPRRRR